MTSAQNDSVTLPKTVTHDLVCSENLEYLTTTDDEDRHELHSSVDLCYIDPPYNTGNVQTNGFTYHDSFAGSENWLQFMRERLQPTRSLLKDTGVIAVSIDDSEVHHLRVLMDEVFGRNNFIAQIIVDGGNLKNNARFISTTHDYILVYAKSLHKLRTSGIKWRKHRQGVDRLFKHVEKLRKQHGTDYVTISSQVKTWLKSAPVPKRVKVFYNVDSKGLYTYADLSAPGNGQRYNVLHPTTGLPCTVPSRGWGLSEQKMAVLLQNDMIIFGKDETAQPLKKLYLTDKKDQVQSSMMAYSSRASTHLLQKILGRRSSFNNPKNLNMMMDLIDLICPEDGIVLDYFAGSGTTGHAVIELNKKHGSERKVVLVTNNENNIFDDVTRPRLESVLREAERKQVTKQILNIITTPTCN